MALTSAGRTYSCPCCGLGISFNFEEKQLLTLQPPTAVYQETRGANTPMTRVSQKKRVCRQCGFILDLPADDPNNLWAAENYARIRAISFAGDPVSLQAPVRHHQQSFSAVDQVPESPLQPGPTASNGVVPVLSDQEIDTLEISDAPDDFVPPSTAYVKTSSRAK